MALSKKNIRFIDEYLKCFNATKAARLAGYKDNENLHTNASKLLQDTTIKAEIAARLAEHHMTADEALQRLADMARGDITEFITPMGAFDIEAMKAAGKGHLIKKIKQKTVTKIGKGESDEDTEIHDTEIELYPADAALRDILKMLGKYKDSIDITSNGESVNQPIDDEKYNRAISTLADAIREGLSGQGNKSDSKVDTPK